MKYENKLLFLCFVISAAVVSILIELFLLNRIPAIILKSFLIAAVITTLNFVLNVISVKSALKRNVGSFIKIYFWVMGIRFFILIVLVIISLSFLEINRISFIFSILIFYGFYLIFEILYLNIIRD